MSSNTVAPNTATIESDQIPFLDVVDPAFRFDSPEVAQAQERHWYARTPLGLVVLRYAEAQELVRDSRLTHNGKGFMEQNGIPIHDLYSFALPRLADLQLKEDVHFTPAGYAVLGEQVAQHILTALKPESQ